MIEYYIPTQHSQTELVEKRSRFIGQVWRVSSEEEARARIEETKKKRYDARHNCWCYRLREGGVERYSDDGEPQGTAGQPMLNVFQRENVNDVVCVVTRYFGGILLGAGGLVRAYSAAAKDALDGAGTMPQGKRRARIICQLNGEMCCVIVENSYNGKVLCKDGRFLSTKHEGRGHGLASVEAVVGTMITAAL